MTNFELNEEIKHLELTLYSVFLIVPSSHIPPIFIVNFCRSKISKHGSTKSEIIEGKEESFYKFFFSPTTKMFMGNNAMHNNPFVKHKLSWVINFRRKRAITK